MKTATDISAEDILDKDFNSVNPDQPLTKVKAKMEEENERAIPVVDGKKFKGMISYRDLIKKVHANPETIKAEKIMHQPAEIQSEMNLIELSRMRKESGSKKMVLQEGNRLKGVIGDKDIVQPLKKTIDEIRKLDIEDIMNTKLKTLKEEEKHDKAAEIMRKHKISRLLVKNSQDKLSGLITSIDILKPMVKKEKMHQGDYVGEKDHFADIPCRDIMNPNPLTLSNPKLHIKEAIKKMRSRGVEEVVITDEDNKPEAILTNKDIINYLASLESKETVLLNLINVEDVGEKQKISNKLEKAIQGRLSSAVEKPKELDIHIKRFNTSGQRQRYDIHARFYSELGTTIIEEDDWELLDAVDRIIDKLTNKLKKEKEKRRDRIRKDWNNGDYRK
ncbi:MAG: CBS domain-containing protein [Candidatus Nanohaloarchaeota archaeon QJJ-9]|nr:CBS domain-containing protein [Candidatus Nanohaloarchaeota archaeon QJJ-9]